MPDISPEVQALIDRLKQMDPANPHHDKAAIERAITAHLAALGLPERPFIWADDPRTACQIIVERANSPTVTWDTDWRTVRSDAFHDAKDAAFERRIGSPRGCPGVSPATP